MSAATQFVAVRPRPLWGRFLAGALRRRGGRRWAFGRYGAARVFWPHRSLRGRHTIKAGGIPIRRSCFRRLKPRPGGRNHFFRILHPSRTRVQDDNVPARGSGGGGQNSWRKKSSGGGPDDGECLFGSPPVPWTRGGPSGDAVVAVERAMRKVGLNRGYFAKLCKMHGSRAGWAR